MWITKIGFKMRKLWPFKVGSKFQTWASIAIAGNRQKRGTGKKVTIFLITSMKNTLKFVIVIVNLSRENRDPLEKLENQLISLKPSSKLFILSFSLLNPKGEPSPSHLFP